MRKAGRISYVSFAGGRVAIAGDTEDLGARALTPEMCNRVARFRAAFLSTLPTCHPEQSPHGQGGRPRFFLDGGTFVFGFFLNFLFDLIYFLIPQSLGTSNKNLNLGIT